MLICMVSIANSKGNVSVTLHCFPTCPSPENIIIVTIKVSEMINRFKLNATAVHTQQTDAYIQTSFMRIYVSCDFSLECPLQLTRNALYHPDPLGQPYCQLHCGMFPHLPFPLHSGLPGGMNMQFCHTLRAERSRGKKEKGGVKEKGVTCDNPFS